MRIVAQLAKHSPLTRANHSTRQRAARASGDFAHSDSAISRGILMWSAVITLFATMRQEY